MDEVTSRNQSGQSPSEDDQIQDIQTVEDIQDEISRVVSENIKGLLVALQWSQATLAGKIEVSPAALSNYIRGTTPTGTILPPVVALAKICQIARQKGIEFTIDDFLFHKINFGNVVSEQEEAQISSPYLGHYYLYFFDQTSTADVSSIHRSRPLRYGVISVCHEKHVVGDDIIILRAKFFKTLEGALEFRGVLNSIDVADEDARREKILDIYGNDKEIYIGELTFSGKHLFFDMRSSYYGDKALAIFSIPPKKDGSAYIGGLGNMVSVSHGLQKRPVSQKAIISEVPLNASSDQIGLYLYMSHQEFSSKEEAETLLSLYKSLYPVDEVGSSLLGQLDEQDKTAIFHSRLRQLITGAADKYYYSVSSVSDTDDKEVYALIKSSKKAQIKETVNDNG